MSRVNKYHRGDPHPDKAGLFYWGTIMKKGVRRIQWLNSDKLAAYRANQMRLVKKWQIENLKKHRDNQKRMRVKHGKRRNAEARGYRNQWKKDRRKNDPLYSLKEKCSNRLRQFLKRAGLKKRESVHPMLGCTYDELRRHLESKFLPGMTWQNATYYGWHIDHIIPLASAKTMRDVRRLFHYTNLQPLWMPDNFAKSDKMPQVMAA